MGLTQHESPTSPPPRPDPAAVERVVEQVLAEDVGAGDVTTNALFGPHARCRARLVVDEAGVVCGLAVAEAVFRALDKHVRFDPLVAEGHLLDGPTAVASLEGTTRAVLTGERAGLNLLARLSGVATLARAFADAVAGNRAVILDTRKTTPGLRALEKYATGVGGVHNHRQGLYDGVLVKDNHLKLAGGVRAAVAVLRGAVPGYPIEVEVETLAEVQDALDAGADVVLLDNMATDLMAQAVALVDGRAKLEASGGVSMSRARDIADTGVDFISVGALTHSARSLDVSLEVL